MIFYRYDGTTGKYSNSVDLEEYKSIKETHKGHWIISNYSYDDNYFKRWISKTSRKRFAYPTKEEALESFKARKKRQILLLTNQLENAKAQLVEANKINRVKETCIICGIESENIKNGHCLDCGQKDIQDLVKIEKLTMNGHASHCAMRQVYGDGECECHLRQSTSA